MAVFPGKDAKMYFGSDLFTVQNWTVTSIADAIEITGMTDTWQTFLAGLDDFTGTATGLAETTVDYAALIGSTEEIRFYVDGAQYFGALVAIMTGVSESVDIDGRGEVSFSYEGNDVTGIAFT